MIVIQDNYTLKLDQREMDALLHVLARVVDRGVLTVLEIADAKMFLDALKDQGVIVRDGYLQVRSICKQN